MRGAVLRGDFLRLRRRGDRVWIRHRPYEIFWRTTHSFAVDDIRLIEIQPVETELWRRRAVMGLARRHLAQPALTRLTIQSANEEVTIELHETEAAIAALLQDLEGRLAAEGGWRQGKSASQLAVPPVGEELDPIGWSPAPEPETNTDLQRNLPSVGNRGDRDAHNLVDEDLFGAGPPEFERQRRQSEDNPDAARSRSMSADDGLFPDDQPTAEAKHGAWIRKRRRRTPRIFGRRATS